MRPLKNNIVVAQEAKKKTTQSGIILSSEVKDTVKMGVVMFVGPEVETVKVGDTVLPNWQMAKPLNIGSQQQAVLSEDDILVIMDE